MVNIFLFLFYFELQWKVPCAKETKYASLTASTEASNITFYIFNKDSQSATIKNDFV